MPETAVVTLLFCDLVGSTELLRSLGDDANDEVRRELFAALERVVADHRCTVVKSAGDGMMVSFRTSAADAVACASAMQGAAEAIERDGVPMGLELRIGISSGEASHEAGDWFGTPVVQAARLEAAARPGQILVSEVVRSIVGNRGGAEFRAAGKRELKGFARPVAVAEVVWRDASTLPHVRRKWKRPLRRSTLIAAAALAAASAAIVVAMVFVLRDAGEGQQSAVAPGGEALVAEGYTPMLEPRECPTEFASAPDLRCSDLVVPENRDAPAGRSVRLLITTAPSRATKPGVPTLSLGRSNTLDSATVQEYGDSVTIALRGTEDSQPSLTCPEVASVMPETLGLPANSPEANQLVNEASERCARRLEQEGVDLNSYGQADILDDVRDLVIAMGWRQINLEAALDLVPAAILLEARYPGLVRALVLVEPFPPGHAVLDERIRYFDAALHAYYAACAADAACAAAFPDLEGALPGWFERLEREPKLITVGDPATRSDIKVQIDGDRLVVATLRAVGDEGALPVLAAALASNDESSFVASAAYIVQTTALAQDVPWGAWHSRYCEDIGPEVSMAGVSATEAAYPLLRTFAHEHIFGLCDYWPTLPGAEVQTLGVSDVPAFILTGALNPYSPPAFANETARSFNNAQVAVFPSLTGGVIPDGPRCVTDLRLDFLRNPDAKLDIDACAAIVPRIAFAGTSGS